MTLLNPLIISTDQLTKPFVSFSAYIVVDCESLPAPTNGNIQLTSTTYLSTANYSCDQGHLLGGGEGTRVCEAGGEWSGTAPTCTSELL